MPAGSDIFAVQLTADAAGAIACILLTGPGAAALAALLEKITQRPNLAAIRVGAAINCRLHDAAGNIIDDSLLIRLAPARWEIHLHGGTAVVAATLDELRRHGAQILTPDQAAEKNLFGTTLDGEILAALGTARTLTATKLLLDQPAAWQKWRAHWSTFLQSAPFWQFHSEIQWRLARSRTLAAHLAPPRIAIIGPPNAGKSTLANALLGRPVAITSAIPGTTRDWVDADAIFNAPDNTQLAVTLIDTAGIRDTTDAIETLSIARSHHQARTAAAIIALFDATRDPTPQELALAAPRRGCPVIIAANKTDLARTIPTALAPFHPISLSAKNSTGLDTLMHRVLQSLDLATASEEPFAFTPRLRSLLVQLSQADDPAQCHNLLASIL